MLTAKNLLFPVPQKFQLFKPFKLFTIIGHIRRVTELARAHQARRSLESSAERRSPSRLA
jgi:hypothetical protein